MIKMAAQEHTYGQKLYLITLQEKNYPLDFKFRYFTNGKLAKFKFQ